MKIKDEIEKLRKLGKTYEEISKQLSIPAGRVEYYCNPQRREMMRKWNLNYRRKNRLYKKVASFHQISKIKRCGFKYREFLEAIGENPVCYITKTPIDLNDVKNYSIDHIIPNSKGGTNDLSNAGLVRMDINKMKQDKTLDEFISLCKEVLKSNGYKVEKFNS